MTLRSFQFYTTHVRKLLGTDLHLFELSIWIQAIAQALISVFVPIILWQQGLDITHILVFYFLFNAFDVPLNMFARRFIERYGARTAVMLALFMELCFYMLLYNLSQNWLEVAVLALLIALYDTLYWVGHVYIFAEAAHSSLGIKHDISNLNIIRIIGGVIAPAIGAWILIVGGQHTLIFFTAVLMTASLIPLFRMRHLVFKPEVKGKSFEEFFRHPYERANYLFEVFSGCCDEVEVVIWPFFVYFVFKTVQSVALIPILISLTALVTTYVTGKKIIRENIYKLVAVGAAMIAVFWAVRYFFFMSQTVLYVSVLLIALAAIVVSMPLEVTILERGKRSDVLSASTYLNMSRMTGRLLLYIILLFVGDIFHTGFVVGIGAAVFMAVFSAVVARKKKEIMKLFPQPVEVEAENPLTVR